MLDRTKTVLASLLVVVVLFTACPFGKEDLIKVGEMALANSDKLFDALAAQGKITAEQATWYKTDFHDAANAISTFRTALTAAAGDKVKKAQAALALFNSWRSIYDRGHFKFNDRASQIAGIVDYVVTKLLSYYSGTQHVSKAGKVLPVPRTESDLEKDLKPKIEELKRLTKE